MTGALIVSLDFELFWGMLDVCPLEKYRENVLGGRKAIPQMLELFRKYDIHATWATVGFQFAQNREELQAFAPPENFRPSYENRLLDAYAYLQTIRPEDEACFFAPELIRQIAQTPGQEIGSHTFCHYYCRERGQTLEQFRADLQCAQAIARAKGYTLKSMVLPRNQTEAPYTRALAEAGFTSYRAEEKDWIHKIPVFSVLRAFRLLDRYLPLVGLGGWIPRKENGVWNLAGVRSYKPIIPKLWLLEGLKMHRIKAQMLHAAKRGLEFHMWWHPHNLGINTARNLAQLEELFQYYDTLRQKYGMVSLNMAEAAEILEREEAQ